ncbi:RNase P subunit p30-domain-containing protein [Dactylonectria estremocensis]|uniref:RNase P subunit p30-domain-containing protein n=1 Tax=Dactylonectria estremocensis TaxID=1079267 RepID=A0A9P9E904_9HYPO|nr:RNase P subunit p30-domain-containing protein [Dactylonectria estremocensis]
MYDLNIAWSPSTTPDQLLQTLTLASALGYATVALNNALELPIPAIHAAPFPPTSSWSSSSKKIPSILHRATVPLVDPAVPTFSLPTLVAAYDLVAVQPLTEKAFQSACIHLDIPLISLDLTQHFPFHFRPKNCMTAVNRGVRFEVSYAQALVADPRGRATFIGNVTNLIRATRGRGIILSSAAKDVLSLRAPADVVNLLSVWGLPSEKGMLGLGALPRGLVVNEGIRRSGFRGVIDVVEVAKRDEEGQDEAAGAQAGKKNKSKAQNQKRKNGDEAQTMSKRQAKKMKLASRAAAAEKSN